MCRTTTCSTLAVWMVLAGAPCTAAWAQRARPAFPARDLAALASSTGDRGLPAYPEAIDLVAAGQDSAGRTQWLRPDAAAAWRDMRRAAQADGVVLVLVSAFRSLEQQWRIFERKLHAGQTLADILAVNVPPGFSEHHTGTAVDIGTPGSTALLETFERTAAFRWLLARAEHYGFTLSYPRGNTVGLAYEPWHWAWGAGRDSGLLQ